MLLGMVPSAERDCELVARLGPHALIAAMIDVRGFHLSAAATELEAQALAAAQPLQEAGSGLLCRARGVTLTRAKVDLHQKG
jgi:hypothetical protein